MNATLTAHRSLIGLALLVVACNPVSAEPPEPETLLESQSGDAAVTRPDFRQAPHAEHRNRMVSRQIEARGVEDPSVLAVMRRVPRHEFTGESSPRRAYADMPLPIGYGQTISQPFIVAYMTELLQVDSDDRVLEVGTGSGYQAAIVSELVGRVTTIEIVRPLAVGAAERLNRLGYRNISVLHGDGYYGWREGAPYDAVVVTAAAAHVPPPLIAQLKPGGRMVIPVGRSAWTQNLLLVEKARDGTVSTRNLIPVVFVPLTGGH